MKFCLTFDQLDHMDQRYSGLTVDYGAYFKLTVDFHFDQGRRSEYRIYWSATPLCILF